MQALKILAKALDNDEKAKTIYMTTWVNGWCIPKTLIDGGSMVDLISQDIVEGLSLPVFHTEEMHIRLAND